MIGEARAFSNRLQATNFVQRKLLSSGTSVPEKVKTGQGVPLW
jgi:hypothetical protein